MSPLQSPMAGGILNLEFFIKVIRSGYFMLILAGYILLNALMVTGFSQKIMGGFGAQILFFLIFIIQNKGGSIFIYKTLDF